VLYSDLLKYTEIPRDAKGQVVFESIVAYADTADEGNDYLCVICAGLFQKQLWILDVYYTKKGMEVTEPETANFLVRNKVDHVKIESNSGGRGFARNVERILWDQYQTRKIKVSWFHQSSNKLARILTNSNYVMKNVFFPDNWHYKFPGYHGEIIGFKKEGGNLYDDGADATTGLVEMVEDRFQIYAIDSFPGSR
ncbi:phage terminase large subunit, partial [bacterium]|nr:phage terminase large subunit [bacterium]